MLKTLKKKVQLRIGSRKGSATKIRSTSVDLTSAKDPRSTPETRRKSLLVDAKVSCCFLVVSSLSNFGISSMRRRGVMHARACIDRPHG